MPSLWEACGLLAMETMVAGVPLIGTNCIGLREVLRDTPAVAVSPRDSVSLANELFDEMNSPSTTKALEFLEEASRRFDVRKQAKELEDILLELIYKGPV
jgi:glycosyltransferase involved in cell wall biosynthesis